MAKDIVLCVDDESIVLRACTMAVAQAGFRPIVAENGAAGLECFLQFKDEICLVLADIIMPAVSGITMAENIHRISPNTRILLMSGYSDEVIEQEGRNRFPFIRKPFIFATLIQKIRATIDPSADTAAAG